MNTYRVLRAFAYLDADGKRAQAALGSVVELSAAEAKPLAKIKAIGLHFEDDDEDEAPVVESRASKRASRTRKPKEADDAPLQD